MSYTRDDVLRATQNLTGTTIPVHIELQSKQIVLSHPEMRELLSSAEIIAVGDCVCRQEEKRCDNPLEVCLSIDAEARAHIDREGWREISLEEAMKLLDETSRLGLVHMAYRRGDDAAVRFVCSCCSCCCAPLNALRQFDYHDAITESAFVASLDVDPCIGCGTCVRRCLFGAYTLDEGKRKSSLEPDRCFGCGLCVGTCPVGAIKLVRR
jgi:electron transport complex protein RnfB